MNGELLQPQIVPQFPHLHIVEQPAPKATRFRYKREQRYEILLGEKTTPETKTFPKVKVLGYTGPARLVVSCVTQDSEGPEFAYKPHPHSLVGNGCTKGICILHFPTDTMELSLTNNGIQCVKKTEVKQALDLRQSLRIDPFGTGYLGIKEQSTVNLKVVRLAFQVYLQDKSTGKYTIPLPVIASEPIIDKKSAAPDLAILELCSCVTYADGDRGKLMIICSKATKGDISVRFFKELNGVVIWQANAEILEVYKGTAISCRPPLYRKDITEPVDVQIQLVQISDQETSEPRPFLFRPRPESLRKRKRLDLKSIQDMIDALPGGERPEPEWNLPNLPQLFELNAPATSQNTDPFDQFVTVGSSDELQAIHLSSGELEAAGNYQGEYVSLI